MWFPYIFVFASSQKKKSIASICISWRNLLNIYMCALHISHLQLMWHEITLIAYVKLPASTSLRTTIRTVTPVIVVICTCMWQMLFYYSVILAWYLSPLSRVYDDIFLGLKLNSTIITIPLTLPYHKSWTTSQDTFPFCWCMCNTTIATNLIQRTVRIICPT